MAIKLSSEEREVFECIRTLCEANGNKGEVSEWDVIGHFRGRLTSIRVLNLMDAVWQKGHTLKKAPNKYVLDPHINRTVPKKEAKT